MRIFVSLTLFLLVFFTSLYLSLLQLTFDPTHSWMEMEGESSQLKKQVNQLQNSVTGLSAKNKEQESKIKNLEKMQFDMNERLRAQERYTSKDCLIICNPPFDPRDSKNVLKNTLRFFSDFLKINLRIKACHFLPGTANGDQYDSVICKFVYFDEKDRVFGARRKLKTAKTAWIKNLFSWMNDYQSLKLNLGLRQIDRASLLRQKIVPYLYWWSETTVILAITTSIKLAILKMSKTRSNEKTKKGNTASMMTTKLMMTERSHRT